MQDLYKLIFSGEIIAPTNELTAKRRLAVLLGVDMYEISHLFNGNTYILHQNIPADLVENYEKGMQKIGLVTHIVPMIMPVENTESDYIEADDHIINNTLLFEQQNTDDSINIMTNDQHDTPEFEENRSDTDLINSDQPKLEVTSIVAEHETTEQVQRPTNGLKYSILFEGVLLNNVDINQAKSELRSILTLDHETIDDLFNGNIHTLQSGLSSEEAEEIMFRLHKLGLDVNVKVDRVLKKDNTFYKIIFSGHIMDSFTTDECIQNFAQLCHTTKEAIQALFNNEVHCLKSKLSKIEAERYIKSLNSIGMIVDSEIDVCQ